MHEMNKPDRETAVANLRRFAMGLPPLKTKAERQRDSAAGHQTYLRRCEAEADEMARRPTVDDKIAALREAVTGLAAVALSGVRHDIALSLQVGNLIGELNRILDQPTQT